MPSPNLNDLVKSAPKGVSVHWPQDVLAALIAGLLSMWNTLYPDVSLTHEVKRQWRMTKKNTQ